LKCTDKYDEETRAIVKLKNPGFTETKPMPKAKGIMKLFHSFMKINRYITQNIVQLRTIVRFQKGKNSISLKFIQMNNYRDLQVRLTVGL